ncbi:MAG: hypothetical protein ACOWYE_18250 [Desulfatiglandales bacterium]
MNGTLNLTDDYYVQCESCLGWELTVCNSLYPEFSPCRKVLKRPDSYGNLLYGHLSKAIPMDRLEQIIEIGGGYGYLMADFIARNPRLKPTMLDISPYLSGRQRETLSGRDVRYIVEDFMKIEPRLLEGRDMAILNENLGDFPTALRVPVQLLKTPPRRSGGLLEQIRRLFDAYGFGDPDVEKFSFNIGAVEAVEKLCLSGIPYVFLSEHSCEAVAPEEYKDLIRIQSTGYPERISLKGHCEYTVKFSYLEKVAGAFHYQTIRGSLADFLTPRFDERLRHVLALRSVNDDLIEIIRHFIEDLFKYEYLILIKR